MISHEYKCVFIHIPKCAGTSIEKKLGLFDQLKEGVQDHRAISEIEPFSPSDLAALYKKENAYFFLKQIRNMWSTQWPLSRERYDQYFKFSFVRNPWERVYSWYKNVLSFAEHQKTYDVSPDCTFPDFVRTRLNTYPLRRQMYWLRNRKGEMAMDFIGRFENLQSDFDKVCEAIGIQDSALPKLLVTKNSAYWDNYTKESRRIVSEFYREEIEYFGYSFGGN